MRQKIPGSKVFSAGPKVFKGMPQVPGNKIMAVFREVRSDEVHGNPVDRAQWNPHESNPRDYLGERAKTFQGDTYKKAFMKNRG